MVQEEEQALDHKARTRTIETVGDLEKCRIWLLPDKLLQYLNTSNVKRLYVVASGPIWSTPFGFLRIDGKFAQEIWEICYVPAARFAGREDVPESVGRAFAVGHPGHSNDLANVEREVNLVGSILDGEVCFHRDASPDFVLKALPRAEVVHIACHSHLDAINSLLTFFELEPDERHRDGRLFLYEIIQQQAGPRIVGLFSCQTASTSDVVSFPETLAYSFIGTGTKYVLASQGPVGDKVCLDFSQAFYQLISEGKEDPVTAFAMAQREMIKHFRSDSANRGIQLRDERLPEMNNFVLITASDAVRSEAIVHHKKVKAEIPEISLYRALLNKARQMTKEFPPCVQNMGPEAEYWNTMPKSKPSAEVIMDFLHLLERSKQGFLSMLAELNPPIEEIAGALQELSRIREHVKFHPAKEVEIRRIIGGLLFQADQFDLPTSEKLTFIESKVLMEPSPGIGDVEHLIFEAEVRRITEESLADTRSFSGAGFESIMTQLCSQIDVEQILSLEVKRNIKQKEKFAIDQSSEVAPRDAQSKLPNGAIIEQMEIVKDRRIGSLEMRADSEKDAKRLFAAQSSKDAKIIDIQCLDPGRKGILRVIGRRKGNWQIHWTAPCQVAIEYVLPIEVAVQFVSLG